MRQRLDQLADSLRAALPSGAELVDCLDELTLELPVEALLEFCQRLRTESAWQFDQLIDVCGVDYADYGLVEWSTEQSTDAGFSRACERRADSHVKWHKPRFAVVYHLLSTVNNQRLRLRVFPDQSSLQLPSVIGVWPGANWFEREAFDLFGFVFEGHPDLRRILTDYGFIGHPFRKDFPLSGHVEMRYDAKLGRCVYEPVDIQPRTTVPKVIRQDSRYLPVENADG